MSDQSRSERRQERINDHVRQIASDGYHQGAVRLAAYLLTSKAAGRYCVSGLCGPETMTFYTDDLNEAIDRSNDWAQRLARTFVETHITDLDRDPVRRTFQITVTFEIVAVTAEDAEELWADNGPEVGPGITMDPLPTWTDVSNNDRDGGAR